jgi:inhibitor of cysteine peptidase
VLREVKKRALAYSIAAVLIALLLGTLCYNIGVKPEPTNPEQPSPQPSPEPSSQFLKTFSSYQELLNFLFKNTNVRGVYPFYGPLDINILSRMPVYLGPTPIEEGAYSTTNVQVAGVDEADIVKTDGEYVYVIANNTVYILKANPPENATIISKITFENNTYLAGLFISSDGSKLAVIGSKYSFPPWSYYYRYCYIIDGKTFINVYDISNKTNPILARDFTMTGSYFNSRIIDGYIYAVISQPVYIIYDDVILPKVYSKGEIKEIEATKIYYSNASEDYYTFTTIVALNMLNDTEEPNTLTIMMGGTSNLYVSLDNIYITFHDSLDWQTTIYRIRIENRTMNWEAEGAVPGNEPSQFSMDEWNGYFRITTARWVNGTRQNDLYVLDMNLTIVGNLTNIAPGENLDSTRFIGNRCYLTTSIVQKDPFFIIDVENPREPKFLGKLDIPGFTRYLHPYDDNHLIGVSVDGNKVQILMFDVSNVSSPTVVSNFTVPGEYSDTPVLWEHKAFLFDKAKELLVIPLSIYDSSKTSFWQGVYVFNTTNCALTLKGNVTHMEDVGNPWDCIYCIKRALYIKDMLYTVSEMKLKINWLEDLSTKGEIVFS